MSMRSPVASTTHRRAAPRSAPRASAPPGSQHARRKRAAARRMRRFEGVMARLPGAAWVRPQIVELVRQFAIPAAVQPTPWHYSKLLSGLVLGVTLYALVAVHTQDEWFVYAEDVDFGRLTYLVSGDLYALGAVEGWNGLWLEPQVVAERLRSHPWVAAADVQVHLPARISAQIEERTPIAVWVTNRGTYWLAATGVALAMPPDQAAAADELMLPQLIDSLGEAQQLGVDRLAVDAATLESALALTAALPELESKVRFNRGVGLNFALSNPAVWVYFGDGHNMEIKLENLAAMRTVVLREENTAGIIDVRYINRPYVR